MNLDRLRANLESVRSRMADASRRAGRDTSSTTLVAVTKKNPAEMIRALAGLGVDVLGENYPQELWEKVDGLADLDLRWHLIGHLQGNKARKTLPLVRVVHGVDSLKLLRTIDGLAAELADPPAVCLQVNASGEASKHGWGPDALLGDAEAIASVRNVRIAGLMTMAGYGTTNEEARPAFVRLREARDRLREATGLPLPDLSMGMSGDFEAAIEEGASMVRVGSALFEGVAGD
ncbi:YggS family pyridoxal phosphate-dependent enzyme [Tundrisphaera sp. TA3]|uniref:YggS family pyridoxal phosphate-dependent enzyme n=1 Tax=Tundrisphaera sp. TA3 TaxID=3435775 RepID=UPI003EB74B22